MAVKTNYYVYPKTDSERQRLIDEYEMLGYFVYQEGDRLRITAKRPDRKKKLDERPERKTTERNKHTERRQRNGRRNQDSTS